MANVSTKEKKSPLMLEHQKGEPKKKFVKPYYQRVDRKSSENTSGISEASSWELPVTLNDKRLPNFPVGVFPEWLEDFIQAVSIESQTPIDAPAFATLATISAVVNKKFEIHIRGDWKEYVNLYLTLALDSGNRKSAVFNQTTKEIYNYQSDKRKELSSIVATEKEEIKAKEKRLDKLQSNFAKTPDHQIMKSIKELSKEIHKDKAERTVVPKFTASDATPEKLAMIMAEQEEKIALLSAEGAEVFEMIAGRYGDKPNQDIYLKSFSSEPFDVERVSREPIHLEAPSMVIGLFVQSSVIQNIPDDFTNRGLTQRFLYSFPESLLGYRDVNPALVPKEIKEIYMQNIRRLLEYSNTEPKRLRLSADALTYLIEEQIWVEKKLQDKNINEGMVGWLSKLVGTLIRISGIIHILERIEKIESIDLEIEERSLRRAFKLKEYLIAHAEKGFGIMGVAEKEEDLDYLLQAIKYQCRKEGSREVTYRDVYESVKGRFKTARVYKEKLSELEELYWIKQYKRGKSFISLNPHIALD